MHSSSIMRLPCPLLYLLAHPLIYDPYGPPPETGPRPLLLPLCHAPHHALHHAIYPNSSPRSGQRQGQPYWWWGLVLHLVLHPWQWLHRALSRYRHLLQPLVVRIEHASITLRKPCGIDSITKEYSQKNTTYEVYGIHFMPRSFGTNTGQTSVSLTFRPAWLLF